ncbi:MAG TPA: TIGR01212 family radical SAM protein [Erysipelotrichaceae bacterium]|nr:TIGR01212 family radical SAM protein [Erysipelotrichaceae bacterium]
MNNPFKYSFDNKRYLTWNYYGKSNFSQKIYKVPLDGPFSCPNRDGTVAKGGCSFCLGGSNAFPALNDRDLMKQYQQRKEIFLRKWPDGIPYVYFQSFSSTHAPLKELKKIYQPFIDNPEIKGIVISTRSDCLDEEKISYLNSLTAIKPIWIELGLQSIHDRTLREMNRGHSYQNFLQAIDRLKNTNLKISVHLINGWPSETAEMMLETAKEVGRLPIHAVKFHMLHICKNTLLGEQYLKKPFELLSKEQYVTIVANQLSYLREDIIIERLTGDGLKEFLLAPDWTLKKVSVINDIDKKMVELDLYQGKNYCDRR